MLTASTVVIIGSLNIAAMSLFVAVPITAVLLGCILAIAEVISDSLKPEFHAPYMPRLAVVNKPADHLYRQYKSWAMDDVTQEKVNANLVEWQIPA